MGRSAVHLLLQQLQVQVPQLPRLCLSTLDPAHVKALCLSSRRPCLVTMLVLDLRSWVEEVTDATMPPWLSAQVHVSCHVTLNL